MLAYFLSVLVNMTFFTHANDFTEDELLTKIEEFSNSYSDPDLSKPMLNAYQNLFQTFKFCMILSQPTN
jgi:hypothetical protein